MKKIWLPITIIVIWLVIFVAGPFYTGSKVEEKVDALISKMNTNGVLVFEKSSYKKGLMSSDIELTVTINTEMFGPVLQQMGGAAEIQPITLVGEIKHGPILLDDGFDLGIGRIHLVPKLDESIKNQMVKVFSTATPLNFNIKLNWDNSITARGSLVAFNIADKGLNSSEATFVADITDTGNHMISAFNWDGLEVKDPKQPQQTFAISKVTSASDQKQVIDEIWVGDASFNIQKISFNQAGMGGNVENIGITANSSVDDAKAYLDAEVNVSTDSINVAGVDYLKDLKYTMSFKHLHIASLQKIAKAMKDVQQQGGTPEAIQVAMGLQLASILPELANKGFGVNIDALNATVMGEQITSNLSIDIPEGTDFTMKMAAIAGISVTADVSVSKALLSKIPMGISTDMVQGLIGQGFIIEENGVLKSHAEFKAGELMVNGNPIPLPSM